jgi:hypothetical protein
VELQNLGHGSSGCGGTLLFARCWCGAHSYQELRETALSGALADDHSARRDLRQMGERARRHAGNGALGTRSITLRRLIQWMMLGVSGFVPIAASGLAAPLLAGPDRLEHAGIQQRRGVTEFTALGDVAQQSAHDLAAAGFRQLRHHMDLPRPRDR